METVRDIALGSVRVFSTQISDLNTDTKRLLLMFMNISRVLMRFFVGAMNPGRGMKFTPEISLIKENFCNKKKKLSSN